MQFHMDNFNYNMANLWKLVIKSWVLLVLLSGQALSLFNFKIDRLEIEDSVNFTDNDVLQETTLMWTEKSIMGDVAIRGIQGDPDKWIKEGIKHTFVSQPLYETTLQSSFRLALGFRYADREIFFSDMSYKEIYRLKFENTTSRPFRYNKTLEVMFSGTSTMVYGLAVDWIAGSIYWTDAKYNWISVSPIDKRELYKHVIVTGLDLPFGIAVHPHKGYLFWTDYGAKSKIERSRLDGSERKVLVTNNVVKPQGITIDYQDSKIYWVDDSKETIEITDFEGQNRKVIKLLEVTSKSFFMLFGIAVYKDYIFISDRLNLDIQVYSKENFTSVFDIPTSFARPYDLMMYDASLQAPDQNNPQMTCKLAGCAQLCISQGNGQLKCDCALGYELNQDGKTCKSKRQKMPQYIYTLGNRLCATSPNLPDLSDAPKASEIYCFHKNLSHVQALAMHSHAQLLFYSDTRDKEIVRIRMDLDQDEYEEKEVIAVQTGMVRGLAVDYIASNLYWADHQYNHIMMSRIDGMYPTILVENVGDIRAIDIDMTKNVMYWSTKKSIKVADLDGTNAKDFMTYKVNDPDGIAFDPVKNRLYWCNSWPKPNVTHMNTNNVSYQLSISSSSGPKSGWTFRDVAVFADFMAWTDGKGGVHFAENKLIPGKTYRRTINHTDVDVSHDIITYDTTLQPMPATGSGCDDENGGCDHLCIPKHGMTRVCKCAIGFTLNGTKCISNMAKENFLLFADPYHRQIYQLDPSVPNPKPQGIKIDNLEKPVLVEYDQAKRLVYWVEKLATGNYLKRASLDGEKETVLSKFEQGSDVDSMVVFNNKIYYSASGNIKRIDLSNNKVDSFYTKGDVFPKSLTIDRKTGVLFWASKGSVKLYKSDLCVPNINQLITTINMNIDITGLTVVGTPADKLLMWTSQKIWEVKLSDGSYKIILRNDSASIHTVGSFGGNIFVSQWNQKSIYKVTSGKMEAFSKPLFSRILGLKSYGSDANVKKLCTADAQPPASTVTTTSTSSVTTTTASTTAPTTASTTASTASTTASTTGSTTGSTLSPKKPLPTKITTTASTTTTTTTTENDVNGNFGQNGKGNKPVAAASTMSGKNIYILAGSSVAALLLVVLVLTAVCFAVRRQKKRKPPPTVHYQADSHDNPTYMTHSEVADIPRAQSQDLAPVGATGVSFDPLPPKEGSVSIATTDASLGPVVDTNPLDTSDKAKLVQQEHGGNVDLQDVRFTVDGNSNSVTASYTNGVSNPTS